MNTTMSALLLKAFQGSERLSSVVIKAVQERNGKETEAYRITLTNAMIAEFRTAGGKETVVLHYEEITRQEVGDLAAQLNVKNAARVF